LNKEREMHHKTMHRGILALAVVTSLAVAGAQPAAARELSLMNRLGHLWSAVTGGEPGVWSQVAGWLGGGTTAPTKAISTAPDTSDRGKGMDPNGNSVVSGPLSDPLGVH
jgi:hypothetical protein